MPHSPIAAEPLVLADSMAPATDRPELVLLAVHGSLSPAERQPAECPDRELVRVDGCAFAIDRAEAPSKPLRRQNCGCSPLAQPSALPPKGLGMLGSPVEASDKPELAGAKFQ